jgi:hypothetical protein
VDGDPEGTLRTFFALVLIAAALVCPPAAVGCGGLVTGDVARLDAGTDASSIIVDEDASSGSTAPTGKADATAPHEGGVGLASCTWDGGVTVLYAGDNNGYMPDGIAVDSTSVYWAENLAGFVRKVPSCGGPVVTLAADKRPVRVAVNGTRVYWTDQFGFVKSTLLDGSGPLTIASMPSGECFGLALDGRNVYWTTTGMGVGLVTSAPLLGGPLTTLASGQDDPVGLAVSPTAAYWRNEDIYGSQDGGALLTVPLDGGTPIVLSPWINLSGPTVAVDATSVYWAVSGNLLKMPLAGGAALTLASNVNPYDIAVDSSNVYWTDRQNVMKVSVDGGTPGAIPGGFGGPRYLALDDTSVYWTEMGNAVVRAPK